jgi:excisionase family DNA binding protein
MESQFMQKLALSVPQAAEAMSVSERFMRKLIANGTVPSIRVGGRVLVRYTDLEAYTSRLAAPEPLGAAIVPDPYIVGGPRPAPQVAVV